MRFEELPHWNDGQFLQPHHFQYQQKILADYVRLNRRLIMHYPYGLIDLELDLEALEENRIAVKRFSAIMKNGLELSMPGNCILKPLDLSEALKGNPEKLTVYVAVPDWSELEANLADENHTWEKKLYLTQKKRLRDENSGDNEITFITRKLNARLVSDVDDNKDMQLLPVIRLNVITSKMNQHTVKQDESYIPPFMLTTTDDPLYDMTINLMSDIRRCRDKLQDTVRTFSTSFATVSAPGPESPEETLTHTEMFSQIRTILLMRQVTLYDTRLASLVTDNAITPFELYVELASFLAELMGVNPYNSIKEIRRYDHDDRLPVFSELFKDIRSFVRSEGGAGYIRLDFSPTKEGGDFFVPVKPENLANISELYITIKTSADSLDTIRAIEQGDTFRLINPSSKSLRIRGIKLVEMRYPPRFLPVMDWTLWFKLDVDESSKVWREMCEERGMMIDCARDLFPGLEASLFITVVK
jgi:type VI secretion system ImpJ/VasE family protein